MFEMWPRISRLRGGDNGDDICGNEDLKAF